MRKPIIKTAVKYFFRLILLVLILGIFTCFFPTWWRVGCPIKDLTQVKELRVYNYKYISSSNSLERSGDPARITDDKYLDLFRNAKRRQLQCTWKYPLSVDLILDDGQTIIAMLDIASGKFKIKDDPLLYQVSENGQIFRDLYEEINSQYKKNYISESSAPTYGTQEIINALKPELKAKISTSPSNDKNHSETE